MSDEPLAITFLITGLSRGGAETQLLRIARELSARGTRVEVFCLGDPDVLSDEFAGAGIPVTHLGIDPRRPNPLKLVSLLKSPVIVL